MSAASAVEIARYAEQMNEQNTCTGETGDWTNPSKCLVDKALEQWSTTRMRADNTSVVILMIDPPGPPKRDVLKSSSSSSSAAAAAAAGTQHFLIQEGADGGDDDVVPTTAAAPAETFQHFKPATLFDHSTKESVDLINRCHHQHMHPIDNHPMPTSGLATVMTHYDDGPVATASIDDHYPYAVASTSSSGYLSSFAETYQNALLNPLQQQQHDDDERVEANVADAFLYGGVVDTPPNEPYCLTRLESRSEHYKSTYEHQQQSSMEFMHPPPTSLEQHLHHTFDSHHHHHQHDALHQYDSISSSFLSQSCHIIENQLDDSIQSVMQMNVEETDVLAPVDELLPSVEESMDVTTLAVNDDVAEEISATDETSANDDQSDRTEEAAAADESIQIHEVSSSSKENDNVGGKLKPSITAVIVPRMTRSMHHASSGSLRSSSRRLSATRNQPKIMRKKQVVALVATTKSKIQNENNVTKPTIRRMETPPSRSLRSKDVVCSTTTTTTTASSSSSSRVLPKMTRTNANLNKVQSTSSSVLQQRRYLRGGGRPRIDGDSVKPTTTATTSLLRRVKASAPTSILTKTITKRTRLINRNR